MLNEVKTFEVKILTSISSLYTHLQIVTLTNERYLIRLHNFPSFQTEEPSKKTNGVLPKETLVAGNKASVDAAKTLHDEVHPKPEVEEEQSVVRKPEMTSWAFTTSGHSRGVTRTDDLTAALNAGLVQRPQVSDVKEEVDSHHDDHVIEWKGFSDDVASVADSFAALMGENPPQKSVDGFGDEKEEDFVVRKDIEKVESGQPSIASQFTESSFGSLGVGDPSSEVFILFKAYFRENNTFIVTIRTVVKKGLVYKNHF